MDLVALLTKPTRSIFGNYGSDCYSVLLARQWSIQDWIFMNGSPYLAIGYLLKRVQNACGKVGYQTMRLEVRGKKS